MNKEQLMADFIAEFDKIINELRPGTLDHERVAIRACMAAAAQLGVQLLGSYIKSTNEQS